ncbi:transcription factor DYT1 [Citrus sinensis]|uniref:Transcription factor DYT1 n=1 Tax=Citrus sinensis TaxID=2711 RepID=A0ACB8NFI6_CITSI|nr:transcription factor DYT1 [Citrus sinensis]
MVSCNIYITKTPAAGPGQGGSYKSWHSAAKYQQQSPSQPPPMEFVGSASTQSCITQKRGRRVYGDDRDFKSKNLTAERRRREKLSNRLLTLRSLMNKATIVEDAITYIEKLQMTVKVLSDQLLEMESSSEESERPRNDEINAAEEMKKHGIEEKVEVTNVDGCKLWIRIISEKKRSRITKFLEAMASHGFELSDTNVTTFKGATLISSCLNRLTADAEISMAISETETSSLEALKGAEPVPRPAPSEVGITSESPSITQMGKHHSTDDSVRL